MATRKPSRARGSFFDQEFSLPKSEERVLKFWQDNAIFEKSIAQRRGKRTFVFYEGPPGANGRPGIHHVLSRVYKDIVLRYKTMRGYHVPRKSGWDTHGLPVEITAEKELGLKSKKEIEAYGIAAFNKKCQEVVWQYEDEWAKLTQRIGFWLDLKDPYVTYEPKYIESLWWIIKKFADRKLFQQGHKVVPWCTRCGTALSSHELAQGYKEVTDTSVYMKFRLVPGQKFGTCMADDATFVLSWTTTPWTLPGNLALAIGPAIAYAAVRPAGSKEAYIVAKDLIKAVFKDEAVEVLATFKGKELVGLRYEPMFDIKPLRTERSHLVYPADFVTTTDGTGVVHTAVMYGEDDYVLGKNVGLPQYHTVDEAGLFTKDVPHLAGLPVKAKETEAKIFDYLKERNLLLRTEGYTHEYPHCWRCSTPLLYYARTSWFVLTSKVQKGLQANNKKINWIPAHIKNGRFGEWLKEAKDWNFSRERYWGTPIPAWQCQECGATEVVGSLAELSRKAVQRNTFLFARHGYATNLVRKVETGRDTPEFTAKLTPKGVKDVQRLAAALKRQKLDLIVSSPLFRMKQTAEIIAAATGVPVEYHRELADIDPGVFENRPSRQAHAMFADKLERFTKPFEGGESLNDLKRRVWRFFKKLDDAHEGKRIMVLTHGDCLWILKGALEGKTNEEILKLAYPKTGSLYPIEYKRLPLDDEGNLNLHRPYIDEVLLHCGKCPGTMRRIKEVADVWYDSGAMPLAQWHYPFEHKPFVDGKQRFPADFIAEGIDQTRGWFYTLLAVSTLLGKEAPYKNVISLGLIHDKFGQKMSKSKGNVVDPWAMTDKYGIDAVRWYFFTLNEPGDPKNFDEGEIVKTFRKMHLILYNSFGFLKLYAPKSITASSRSSINVLDKWILSRLAETARAMTSSLEAYAIRAAALELERFIDDLSRWYIRRSRRRLQKPEDKKDYEQASRTLAVALLETSKLIAPFTPFFAEALYQELAGILKGVRLEQSVHLADWPQFKSSPDKKLTKGMAAVRQLASVGLAQRAAAGIKVRQPLSELRIKTKELRAHRALLSILADEVNVRRIVVDSSLKEEAKLDFTVTPELAREGQVREFIRLVQELRQKANYRPSDRIKLMFEADSPLKEVVLDKTDIIKKEVGASEVALKRSDKFEAEISTPFDGSPLWLAVIRTKGRK